MCYQFALNCQYSTCTCYTEGILYNQWIIHKFHIHDSVQHLFFDIHIQLIYSYVDKYKICTYIYPFSLQDGKQFHIKLPTAIAKLKHNCDSSCQSYRTITCVGLCGENALIFDVYVYNYTLVQVFNVMSLLRDVLALVKHTLYFKQDSFLQHLVGQGWPLP